MSRTRHMQVRMNQRAISQEIVDLVLSFGEPNHRGQFILNRQAAAELMERLNIMRHNVARVFNKGGVVVVQDGEKLVTTYNYRRAVKRGVAAKCTHGVGR